MALVKYSRLSVQPVTAEGWKIVREMECYSQVLTRTSSSLGIAENGMVSLRPFVRFAAALGSPSQSTTDFGPFKLGRSLWKNQALKIIGPAD
jgi:hypothetical protein